MIYIGRVTALAKWLRLWVPRMGPALLVLPLAFAVGCGSGSGDTTTTDAAVPPRVGSDGGGRAAAPKPPAKTGRGQEQARDGSSRKPSTGGRGTSEKTPGSSIRGNAGKDSAPQPHAGKQRVSKACPSGISRSECETLVAGYQQTKDKPSHAVQEPEDCLKAMSRAECEGLLEGQQEAAEESGSSVDVQQCLQKPTPRCEEVLRAAFEAQVAAGATGK